jgi:hypothetical protein
VSPLAIRGRRFYPAEAFLTVLWRSRSPPASLARGRRRTSADDASRPSPAPVSRARGPVVECAAHALAFAVGLLLVGGLAGLRVVPATLTAAGLASTLASGLFCYGLAYWCYLTGLRSVPASVAAVSFYLIPVFGVGAALLLGEWLGPAQWARSRRSRCEQLASRP